jgi:excisionase family DNA binding protein
MQQRARGRRSSRIIGQPVPRNSAGKGSKRTSPRRYRTPAWHPRRTHRYSRVGDISRRLLKDRVLASGSAHSRRSAPGTLGRCRDFRAWPTFNSRMDDDRRTKLARAGPRGDPLPEAARGRLASSSRRRTSDGLVVSNMRRSRGSKRASGSTQLPTLVDINEIADHLGVTVRHVRQLVAERRIPYVKWGKLLRFDPHEIASWLAGRSVEPLLRGRPRRRAI